MTNLIELHAIGENCGIIDENIKNINLSVLYTHRNKKITNIRHMTNMIDFRCI